MKKNYLVPALALFGLVLYGCDNAVQDIQPAPSQHSSNSSGVSTQSHIVGADTINFEGLAPGTIVSSVTSAHGLGPIAVWGTNTNFRPSDNAAMIFNSAAPTGGDPDLGSPNIDFGGPGIGDGGKAGATYENKVALGKVLIITHDFVTSNPNDANIDKAIMELDFTEIGGVTIHSMNIMDIDSYESAATVQFYDAMGNQIGSSFSSPITGDNGLVLMQFGSGVSGVYKMIVTLYGSGAIDNIAFSHQPPAGGCTATLGYWKTHSAYGPAAKPDNTWNMISPSGPDSPFYLSGKTYFQAINQEAKGNAYYILAPQFIAARLNMLRGAEAPAAVQTAMNDAHTLFSTYTPAQIAALKGSNAVRQEFITISELLDSYNNGEIGPGHCD